LLTTNHFQACGAMLTDQIYIIADLANAYSDAAKTFAGVDRSY